MCGQLLSFVQQPRLGYYEHSYLQGYCAHGWTGAIDRLQPMGSLQMRRLDDLWPRGQWSLERSSSCQWRCQMPAHINLAYWMVAKETDRDFWFESCSLEVEDVQMPVGWNHRPNWRKDDRVQRRCFKLRLSRWLAGDGCSLRRGGL